ncbi:hypothetical protein OIU77_020773 [Salix suchowensis]|uniref:Uncharacterized protein n=1 Tax=Salix suchowensis TaxID=1278906 RepID=A0ABQ9C7K4_9ROSI|nr:hypothetical protein OIU77_020773 [Salix suchowensis]
MERKNNEAAAILTLGELTAETMCKAVKERGASKSWKQSAGRECGPSSPGRKASSARAQLSTRSYGGMQQILGRVFGEKKYKKAYVAASSLGTDEQPSS